MGGLNYPDGARFETEDEWRERLNLEAVQVQYELERQEAYAAVVKAIANYHWYSFANISATVRAFITGLRRRLGLKLWP